MTRRLKQSDIADISGKYTYNLLEYGEHVYSHTNVGYVQHLRQALIKKNGAHGYKITKHLTR